MAIQRAKVNQTAPVYRLTEKAYIDDKLLDPGEMPIDPETEEPRPLLINFDGKPGPHMEPVNDAAKEAFKKHWPKGMNYVDPIQAMATVQPAAATIAG